jgi:hypothetical protein
VAATRRGDHGAIGRFLTIDDAAHEVVGVASADFIYPAGSSRSYEAFVPLIIPAAQRLTPQPGAPFLTTIGRLSPGVPLSDAQVHGFGRVRTAPCESRVGRPRDPAALS